MNFSNQSLRVAQIVDSLQVGGAEAMAVQLANALDQQEGVASHLVVTRVEGPMKERLSQRVGYLHLRKRGLIDLRALFRLYKYLRLHQIQVVHAHSTSFLYAILLKAFCNFNLVWHDHYGESINLNGKRSYQYISFSRWFDYVICVSKPLLDNARRHLRVDPSRIIWVPNFATQSSRLPAAIRVEANRFVVVILAGNRPQKDYANLLTAIAIARKSIPEILLYALGNKGSEVEWLPLQRLIDHFELQGNVCFTGEVNNAGYFLDRAQAAVLSSRSEGLPLALLEYGLAGVPVVCTNVGNCPEVLGKGKFGKLVPPSNPSALAEALVETLTNQAYAKTQAKAFKEYIVQNYSQQSVINTLMIIYKFLQKSVQ